MEIIETEINFELIEEGACETANFEAIEVATGAAQVAFREAYHEAFKGAYDQAYKDAYEVLLGK